MGETLLNQDEPVGPDLNAAHCPGIRARLASARVAVAGLGGLGSHVAAALARCGLGRLRLVDFDLVEPSNLGRQNYSSRHLGRPKAEALKELLAEINPAVEVEALQRRLDSRNIPELLAGCEVIVEALDRPESKAELVTTALRVFPETAVVCGSGLAGLGGANLIRSRRVAPRLYVCGDEQSEAGPGRGLMAPRVLVCAGHQANLVLRLLLGRTEVD